LGGFDRQLRAVALSRLVGQRLRMLSSKPRQQDLQVLQELIEAGKVTAVIDRTFPLSQVPQAIRYLVEGHGGGKIVITVWPLCRVLPARSLCNCFHLILPWQQRAL
jgi:NADPH:quinone reductase-like Zn-dependent oxidoreductase